MPSPLPSKGDAPSNSDRTPQTKALYAAIDSSIYEWRDMVVSCPILAGKDQKQIRHHTQQVEFVYLNTLHPTQQLAHSCPTGGAAGLVPPHAQIRPCDYDDGVLTLNASERIEHICLTVVSKLLLKH